MKKIYLFIVASLFWNLNAQKTSTPLNCINGPLNIYLSQTSSFTSSTTAQCTNCYDWDINNSSTSSNNDIVGNVQIVGNDFNQSVQLKGLSLGSFTLQLTYFDETGCHECSISGNVINGDSPTPLPSENCFGFDPPQGGLDINSEGTLNYAYVGYPYGTPISSSGLTFTWYFKFENQQLLTFNVQNPTFREKCPENPVRSFALIISNGVQTKQYRSIDPAYPIQGISSIANTPTCFLHACCSPNVIGCNNGGIFRENNTKSQIIVSPNPTSSKVTFIGENLDQYTVTIFDSNGNKIINESDIENSIELKSYKKGIYLYILEDKEGNLQKGKIIKE